MNKNRTEQINKLLGCQVGNFWDEWSNRRLQTKGLTDAPESPLIHMV